MRAAARAIGVLIAVAVVAWVCAEAAPGTAGERAARAAGLLPTDDKSVSEETRAEIVAEVEDELGLDRSFPSRLGSYLVGLVTLDMGRSWRDGEPVRTRVGEAMAPTLALIFAALLLTLAIGIGAALVAVERRGGADLLVSAAAATVIALPTVWIAILALRTFAFGSPWRWFPVAGIGVLPVVALAIVPAFILARYARAGMLERLGEPWATAVLARGATRRRLVYVHALRVAASGLVSVSVTLVAYLLGATLVIERVFSIRGIGALVLDAAARGDAPVVVGVAVAIGALLAVVSLSADAVRRALDPRLRDEVMRGA